MFLSDSRTDLPGDGATTGWISASSKAHGRISQHTDTDWYRTYLVAGVAYTLTMDADNLDAKLSLRDSAGVLLQSDTGLATFRRAGISYTPTVSGYYYLDAQAAGNVKSAGTYTLELESSQGDDQPATSESTSTLTLGQAGSGNIEMAGDADRHRVVLNAGQTYSFDLGGALSAVGQVRVVSESGRSEYAVGTNHVSYTPFYSGFFFVEVSGAATTNTGTYDVTVTAQASLSVPDVVLAEGDEGSRNMSFVISQPVAATDVTLRVATRDETAVAGRDYQALNTTVTIPAGVTSVTVTVPILGNTAFTPNRTFGLGVNVVGDSVVREARGFIVDDDASADLALPTDSMLGNQWYLYTTRVEQAWALATGKGVTVAVFDEGIDASHPDLAANVNLALGRDALTLANAGQPVAVYDAHGTMVAGVIGAARNGAGLVGVAYDAQLVSIYQSYDNGSQATLVNAFTYAKTVDVMNNSWGFSTAFVDYAPDSYFVPVFQAMQDAATLGRGGLGTVMVWSAGNSAEDGDDTNLHNFTNNRNVITVGATDYFGHAAPFTVPGASVLVCAPGGGGYEDGNSIFTTDRPGASGAVSGDSAFVDGTSFSAPLVSGVVALMLEVNPRLGLRDVQEILAYTARQVDIGSGVWDTNGAKDWNGGGLHYNAQAQIAGFGQVDALGAVRLAASWDSAPQVVTNVKELEMSLWVRQPIPDNNSTGLSNTITVRESFTVERVDVYVRALHPFIGDLTVTLTSPSGTQSVLLAHPDQGDDSPNGSAISDIYFTFDTVLHWGENAAGGWKLTVVDSQAEDVGSLDAWQINIVGKEANPNHRFVFTDEYATMLAADPARGVLSDSGNGQATLNAAALSGDCRIDLSRASTSTLGGAPLTIAAGTTIAKAIGGAGHDTLIASSQDSVLRGMGGNDTLVGGSGTDTAIFGANRGNYLVSQLVGSYTVAATTGTEGTDTLTSVERLQFADAKLALDTGITQSAGEAALLIGAVLPGQLVFDASKQALMGSVMSLFDSGYTPLQLSGAVLRLPIWDVLTGHAAPTHSDIANYLLTNVNGHAPEAATLQAATTALATETTQGTWLSSLMLSSAAQTHIDLVGVAQSGIVYV